MAICRQMFLRAACSCLLCSSHVANEGPRNGNTSARWRLLGPPIQNYFWLSRIRWRAASAASILFLANMAIVVRSPWAAVAGEAARVRTTANVSFS